MFSRLRNPGLSEGTKFAGLNDTSWKGDYVLTVCRMQKMKTNPHRPSGCPWNWFPQVVPGLG